MEDRLLKVSEAAKVLRLGHVHFRREFLQYLDPIKISKRTFLISERRLKRFIRERTEHTELAGN